MDLTTRKYLITNEVLNAVTHGIGAILSIVALVFLLFKAETHTQIATYAVYGGSMILLFLFSTLFHSLFFTRAQKVFQVFDHCSIFLMIAGTYTTFCVLAIDGIKGDILLGLIWGAAIVGIIYKAVTLHKKDHVSKVSTILYNIMGWSCIIAIPDMYATLGMKGFILLVLGGIAYSVGSIFYSLKKVPFMHVVWHLFVMLGAALMYFTIYFFT